jgi:signal transduction histidine kinase
LKWLEIEGIALILALAVFVALGFFVYNALNIKFDKKKTELTNLSSCRQVQWREFTRNWTDYFWSNSMRFAWITLILISFIIYGAAISINFNIKEGAYISILFSILSFIFFIFSYISYKNFPGKAKAALEAFEQKIRDGIQKEISFEGDNIQQYAAESDKMDTKETTFEFAVGPKKVDFPPFESRPPKKPVIKERKLEFLILSREYFSICKAATPFNLLNPAKLPDKKKCAPKTACGECSEYYYSQMKRVIYEDEKIKIFFNNDEKTIEYTCPKRLGKHKAILKALKEKLRITERQRLAKIQEHEKFEEIARKNKNIENDENEEIDDEASSE